MNSATDLPPNDLAILIVGDPGSRKTTLALQFPAPYVFDADCNMSAPLNFLKARTPGIEKNVFYDRASINEKGEPIPLKDQFTWMNKCLNAAVLSPFVQTIICDSFSALTDIFIMECKRQANPTFTQEQLNKFQMRIQDWGTFGFLIREWVMRLRAAGKILIITAHQKMEQDEADKRWKLFLNIPGQSATNVSGMFTDVWVTYPAITGVGAQQAHIWKVRTLPTDDNDHRGVKSSFGLANVVNYDDVVAKVKTLAKP